MAQVEMIIHAKDVSGMESHKVAISMVYPIMKTIVHKGFDRQAYCQFAGFDDRLLQDAEARIGGDELEHLMQAAAVFTGDEYYGLHQGQIVEIEDMGVLGYVMMHSGNVGQALAAYQRYNAILSSQFNLDWEVRGSELHIRLFLLPSGQLSRHCAEDMTSTLYRLITRFTSRPIPLHGIAFAHAAPEDMKPYQQLFGIVPEFDADDHVLRLHKDVLDYPILYANSKLREVFEAIANESLNELIDQESFSSQVLLWMKKLPTTFPSLQLTAEAFHMSARTLQHRLKQEETSFNDLCALVRKEMAMRYLDKTDYSIGDIAYALHYSEPSAFQNAFKKWTGVTPGQYRIQVRS